MLSASSLWERKGSSHGACLLPKEATLHSSVVGGEQLLCGSDTEEISTRKEAAQRPESASAGGTENLSCKKCPQVRKDTHWHCSANKTQVRQRVRESSHGSESSGQGLRESEVMDRGKEVTPLREQVFSSDRLGTFGGSTQQATPRALSHQCQKKGARRELPTTQPQHQSTHLS